MRLTAIHDQTFSTPIMCELEPSVAISCHNQHWPSNFIIASQPGRNLYGFQLPPGVWRKAQCLKNWKKDVAQSRTHNKILAAEQQYKINTD